MSNFVYDDTPLTFPKSNLLPLPPGADPAQWVADVDWNTLSQAAIDLRDAQRNGRYHGFVALPADPNPALFSQAWLWVKDTGELVYRRPDTSSAALVGSDRQILTPLGSGIQGGGDLSADRSLSLRPTGITPGQYHRLIVGADGRAISGDNPSGGGGTGREGMSIVDIGEGQERAIESFTTGQWQRVVWKVRVEFGGSDGIDIPIGNKAKFRTQFRKLRSTGGFGPADYGIVSLYLSDDDLALVNAINLAEAHPLVNVPGVDFTFTGLSGTNPSGFKYVWLIIDTPPGAGTTRTYYNEITVTISDGGP